MNRANLQALLLDMDGVLYRGSEPLPGAARLVAATEALGLRCLCLTNNAAKTPSGFVAKLARMGVDLPPEAVLTSALATGIVLRERYPHGTTICSLGMDGLREALFADGYFVPAGADARVVVAGINLELTYAHLREATLALRAGADFVATNADRTFPAPEGLVPGAGSIIAALVAASDREPEIIGKPFRSMFDAALHRLELSAEQVLMVGDRLDTDILGAQSLGIPTAWLASGVNSWAEAEAWNPRPTLMVDDLEALLTYLESSR